MALIVKSRRRAASSIDRVGIAFDGEALVAAADLRLAARQRHVDRADLVDGEALADGVDAAEGVEERAQPIGAEAEHLEIEVLGRATEQLVADPAADDERAAAGRRERPGRSSRARSGRRPVSSVVTGLRRSRPRHRAPPEPLHELSACAGATTLRTASHFAWPNGIDLGAGTHHALDDSPRHAVGRLPGTLAVDGVSEVARDGVVELGERRDRVDRRTRGVPVPANSARRASMKPICAAFVAE